MLHRDIKPENMLLEKTGQCKLSDFGTAVLLRASRSDDLPAAEGGGQEIVGTPYYMAPEVVKGEAGAPADVWAIGVTCQQLLTGDLPFQYTNPLAVMWHLAALAEPPPVPDSLPPEAREFIRACLTPEPGARRTAEQLLDFVFLI